MSAPPPVRFAVIGVNHNHINSQTATLLRAGAELVSFYAPEPELAKEYGGRFPQAKQTGSAAEILEDESIHLVVSVAVPVERAPLGIEVMRHGKDFMVDKPGITRLDQLEEVRRVQAETGRIYSICYSERFEKRAAVKALELVQSGAIGEVIQSLGLGPHRARFHTRPPWFFEREKFGGILCDIGSHQFDQFLAFTGAKQVEVVASQVANYGYPQFPEFEDFGDAMLRGEHCSGYIRVDWYTPAGLPTGEEARLFVVGTRGYIEVRKNIDIAGRPGGDHLFVVDDKEPRYIDCSNVELPYGPQLVHDIIHRTETAMTQEHCFLATELALKAQAQASRLGHLAD